MASDIVALIDFLGWKSIDMLGHSMGGFILQQILITPSLPFSVPHAILTATATKPPRGDPAFVAMMTSPPPANLSTMSRDERHAYNLDVARKTKEFGYDEAWLKVPKNQALLERLMPQLIVRRPSGVIAAQALAVRSTNHRPSLHLVPRTTKVLSIHGKLDRIISYSESDYIAKFIPHAKRVQIGNERGMVPSDVFGHTWFDYFDVDVWTGVLESFLDDGEASTVPKAKL
ncbi:alpha/beta-hydrolase [Clavulina sp. PMI_390]|nr:alpha/beta-hydrolase [Clavulina sp. PMI_390]